MLQVKSDATAIAQGPSACEVERAPLIVPKASLAEYEWGELKSISHVIAATGSRTEELAIARYYHLVDNEFKLRGETKGIVLEDGTTAEVRIVGFRHDELANGRGRAGISFEFANVPMRHRMNAETTNKGGWQESEMRDWLNSVFCCLLPQELSTHIVEVEKRTSYRDEVAAGEYPFHVTGTHDRLWLLSMREVYGRLSSHRSNAPWGAWIYDEEGLQYQLYSDNDVSVANYGFCKKGGAGSFWWLRSPYAYNSRDFHYVNPDGGWYYVFADGELDVSPGFCF